MDMNVDAEQIERVLSRLARLWQPHDQDAVNALDSLRPAWLKAAAWDVILEDLAAQRCSEVRAPRASARPRLRLVRG
ncbi:MAG: hypothetical protein J0H50_03645 [Xanthomonadales bacterium]|nr:hypothetical protein [Xanthomonadales bacterium]